MHENFMVVLYWTLLCGPAALGVWGLWRERQWNDEDVTSDTLWESFAELQELPRRLLVLGGGPIGCELAQAFARLGAEVAQVELADRLLAREDDEVCEAATRALRADGVRVLTGHNALRCERDGAEKVLVAQAEGREVRLPFDALLCAVGRRARLEGYGLRLS